MKKWFVVFFFDKDFKIVLSWLNVNKIYENT